MSLLEQLGRRRFALRLPETAVATSDKRLSCSQLCTTHAHTASLGRNRIAPGLWSPQPKASMTTLNLRVGALSVAVLAAFLYAV